MSHDQHQPPPNNKGFDGSKNSQGSEVTVDRRAMLVPPSKESDVTIGGSGLEVGGGARKAKGVLRKAAVRGPTGGGDANIPRGKGGGKSGDGRRLSGAAQSDSRNTKRTSAGGPEAGAPPTAANYKGCGKQISSRGNKRGKKGAPPTSTSQTAAAARIRSRTPPSETPVVRPTMEKGLGKRNVSHQPSVLTEDFKSLESSKQTSTAGSGGPVPATAAEELLLSHGLVEEPLGGASLRAGGAYDLPRAPVTFAVTNGDPAVGTNVGPAFVTPAVQQGPRQRGRRLGPSLQSSEPSQPQQRWWNWDGMRARSDHSQTTSSFPSSGLVSLAFEPAERRFAGPFDDGLPGPEMLGSPPGSTSSPTKTKKPQHDDTNTDFFCAQNDQPTTILDVSVPIPLRQSVSSIDEHMLVQDHEERRERMRHQERQVAQAEHRPQDTGAHILYSSPSVAAPPSGPRRLSPSPVYHHLSDAGEPEQHNGGEHRLPTSSQTRGGSRGPSPRDPSPAEQPTYASTLKGRVTGREAKSRSPPRELKSKSPLEELQMQSLATADRRAAAPPARGLATRGGATTSTGVLGQHQTDYVSVAPAAPPGPPPVPRGTSTFAFQSPGLMGEPRPAKVPKRTAHEVEQFEGEHNRAASSAHSTKQTSVIVEHELSGAADASPLQKCPRSTRVEVSPPTVGPKGSNVHGVDDNDPASQYFQAPGANISSLVLESIQQTSSWQKVDTVPPTPTTTTRYAAVDNSSSQIRRFESPPAYDAPPTPNSPSNSFGAKLKPFFEGASPTGRRMYSSSAGSCTMTTANLPLFGKFSFYTKPLSSPVNVVGKGACGKHIVGTSASAEAGAAANNMGDAHTMSSASVSERTLLLASSVGGTRTAVPDQGSPRVRLSSSHRRIFENIGPRCPRSIHSRTI